MILERKGVFVLYFQVIIHTEGSQEKNSLSEHEAEIKRECHFLEFLLTNSCSASFFI